MNYANQIKSNPYAGMEQSKVGDWAAQASSLDREQSPMLLQQIERLEKSIHILRESMGRLGERLLPVSIDANTSVQSPQPATIQSRPTSPIVDRLKQFEELLGDMNDRVLRQMGNMDL